MARRNARKTSKAARAMAIRSSLFPLAPLMHMAAMWAVWGAMLNGVTIVLDEGRIFDPERMLDTAEREGANMIQFVGDAMATRCAMRCAPIRGAGTFRTSSTSDRAGPCSRSISRTISRPWCPAHGITDGLGASETGMSGHGRNQSEGVMRLPGERMGSRWW
jgi:acyl-coenzyme A synthetase/AMP-(fatty) acid ligase